jgi:hypothetical protein
VRDEDVSALGGKALGGAQSDTARTPGDQRDLACQLARSRIHQSLLSPVNDTATRPTHVRDIIPVNAMRRTRPRYQRTTMVTSQFREVTMDGTLERQRGSRRSSTA